jgi:hypothetical protein
MIGPYFSKHLQREVVATGHMTYFASNMNHRQIFQLFRRCRYTIP